ncbi:KipI family sensor histidine kinase inhibitor [Cohnella lupini]|uniref:KipI family sensor histidine kinase inhibitor n=2 Tax=Cohnella lupini TaxID=1294267 RepID=A0A3D9IQD5_9BACL|nr:KipI family sensor histidine kinase inhibitor [Cohnella lupini]
MYDSAITVSLLGDRAFTLRWGKSVSAAELAAIARAIDRWAIPWLQESIAAYGTITFYLRRHADITPEQASVSIMGRLGHIQLQKLPPPREVEIPVIYGDRHGPDLADSASRSGITEREFVRLHSERAYFVNAMGFAPGFPYLSGMNELLNQPRHATPRLKVREGSVGIAGNQTGVYPIDSPGGWQIIGRTEVSLFRPQDAEPFLLSQGDIVRFVSVPGKSTSETNSDDEDFKTFDNITNGSLSSDPAIQVLKPGLLTTVQDLGRVGWQAFGVSASGVMDELSMRKANLLVGNDENAAVLEMTMVGGSYSIEEDILVAICGADLSATVDEAGIPMNRPVFLRRGAKLNFGTAVSGCRAYLAVAGGIDVPFWLGSRSTDTRAQIGGTFGRALLKGDKLGALPASRTIRPLLAYLSGRAKESGKLWSSVHWSVADWDAENAYLSRSQPRRPRLITLRILAGAEWDKFAPESHKSLTGELYRMEVSSDRMGMRLRGEALTRTDVGELQSHGVTRGTIQVPPDGQPIILAAGCQPTGGYPKIANVVSVDLPLLAQAVPGDWLAFELVDGRTAHEALRAREGDLATLKAGIMAYSRMTT